MVYSENKITKEKWNSKNQKLIEIKGKLIKFQVIL